MNTTKSVMEDKLKSVALMRAESEILWNSGTSKINAGKPLLEKSKVMIAGLKPLKKEVATLQEQIKVLNAEKVASEKATEDMLPKNPIVRVIFFLFSLVFNFSMWDRKSKRNEDREAEWTRIFSKLENEEFELSKAGEEIDDIIFKGERLISEGEIERNESIALQMRSDGIEYSATGVLNSRYETNLLNSGDIKLPKH